MFELTSVLTGYICPGRERLTNGSSIYSIAQTAKAVYQGRGKYTVYDESSNTIISTSGPDLSNNSLCTANDYCVLKMQNDGRLVLYSSIGDVKWSNTNSTISNVANFDDGYRMCSPNATNTTSLFTTSNQGPYESSRFALGQSSSEYNNLARLNNEGPSCFDQSQGSISSFQFGFTGNIIGDGWWKYNW